MAKYRWYKNGRIYVKSRDMERSSIFDITQEYFDDHIGHQTHYDGEELNLYNTNITSLRKLETVEGWLTLNYSKLTSLENLKSVGDNLQLGDTNITSLGNLKHVGGRLGLVGTNLTSLGKLEHVGRHIYCTRDSDTHKLLMNSKFKDIVYT